MLTINDALSACLAPAFSAWFDDNSDEMLVRQISRRVSDVTGLNTTHPAAEPLQVREPHKVRSQVYVYRVMSSGSLSAFNVINDDDYRSPENTPLVQRRI